MLIGLETKNAILIVEFGVEQLEKHGMGIIESAEEAARQQLRPILMTSFAFGAMPMARATGAGAYSWNSPGIVITLKSRSAPWSAGSSARSPTSLVSASATAGPVRPRP